MSVQTIIQSLEKLVNLHMELLEISLQKTEVVKDGSIDKLQAVLLKERKSVRAIEQAEVIRQTEVEEWFSHKQLPKGEATITNMLELITDEQEKITLGNITIKLTQSITKLKQQEQLNQALINQSMQFVQLSLDMMNPSIKNMNYGNKKGSEPEPNKRSVFDSKA
ncbi:flagellar protein FlgN [Virgibacillus profundi]|uniref:Flagellar protein FlgN n=1 Tax=Virgibacillus profundi TaxID=2024555 RepID=A0A2A2IIC8_9BACI|nr:flagellar protein FlgN [Virgibacillus profundi]PAV31014.1 flagellar protein FlgN [Virgibacillus profundi]PXY55199.1 flagellar protein FlgN [Virgibacillus profundi]